MAYYDTITSGPTCSLDDGMLLVAWASSSSPGTTFQVYLDRVLAWSGQATFAHLACPQGPVYVDVVAVDAADAGTDYSSSFASVPSRRATLQWSGGRYLSPYLASFAVYQGTTPGGSVNYSAPVASIPWAPLGIPQDGFGIGGFGLGGFGRSEVRYLWTSAPLADGTWNFAVVPIDSSGNAGTPVATSQAVAAGPAPVSTPTIAVNPTTLVPTISWVP